MVDSWNMHAALKVGDPYSYYDLLRAKDPIHWDAHLGGWFCTRYADVIARLTDKRLCAERPTPCRTSVPELARAHETMDGILRLWMVFKEPPEHSKLRNACGKGFTQTAVNGLRPQIEDIVNSLVDQVPDNGVVDLMSAFAYRLPTRVISPLFGVNPVDIPVLERCADQVVEALGNGNLTVEAANSYEAMIGYLGNVLQDGRCRPDQVVMEAMLEARQTAALSIDELLANCVFLFLAGRDTTTNLIGNGVFTLLKHPDQLEMLRRDRMLIPPAVEEILRFESPVQHVSRIASENMEIGGRTIKAGENVFLSIGAANRDAAQFPEPNRFDIRRAANHHLAFIAGVHNCLGTQLARLEGCLVLNALLERFRSIELVDEPVQWKANPALRALQRLHVRMQR